MARPAALTSWPWQLASEALVEWSAKNWSWKQDPKRKATHISLLLRSGGIEKLFLCFKFIYHLPIIWLGNSIRSSNRLNFGSTALLLRSLKQGDTSPSRLLLDAAVAALPFSAAVACHHDKHFSHQKLVVEPCVNSPATSRWEESSHGTNIIAPLKKCWGQPLFYAEVILLIPTLLYPSILGSSNWTPNIFYTMDISISISIINIYFRFHGYFHGFHVNISPLSWDAGPWVPCHSLPWHPLAPAPGLGICTPSWCL